MAQTLRTTIRGESVVRAFYDEHEENVVAIVEADGTPDPGLSTYATASLHAYENVLDSRDIRVELILVGERGRPEVANVLATAAFFVTKDRWLAAPGVVFPNIVSEYFPEATVKHVMWVEPFDFTGVSSLTISGLAEPIHVLQGVPITDAERDLLVAHGFGALEHALESGGARHYDLARASTV